ncbi:MAG: hypothetical protein NC548_65650 [Lachnospiraceae bacterium]|nr:hypothetical protein [Lachnospiraceae bacterium]
MGKKLEEYRNIYDEEDSRNYEEFTESEYETPEDIIAEMKGTIASGDCIYCGAKMGMKYEGDICFICSECGRSTHENIYYLWAAGYDVYLDNDEE